MRVPFRFPLVCASYVHANEPVQLADINVTKWQSKFNAFLGDVPLGGKIHIEQAISKAETETVAKQRETIFSTLNLKIGAQATGAAASTSLVLWALNYGGLVSTVLATVPVWKSVDPVSILTGSESDGQKGNSDADDDPSEDRAGDIFS